MWGAQGGDCHGILGGRGGYSIGYKELNKNTKLYNVVGGGGSYIGDGLEKISNGGYNGGGKARNQNETTDTEDFSSGGGATHVATSKISNGLLSNYVNNQNAILAVAGGAGGCDNQTKGGAGGGLEGASTPYAKGGTQTAGGASKSYNGAETSGVFGRGANCNTTGDSGAGGGGGWYGGGSSGGAGDGAGGSGHIHSSWTGYFQSGVRSGNGKVVISWHPNI